MMVSLPLYVCLLDGKSWFLLLQIALQAASLAKCWHLFSSDSNQNGWQGARPQNVAHVSHAGSLALLTRDLFAGG